MIRHPPRSTLFPYSRSSDLSLLEKAARPHDIGAVTNPLQIKNLVRGAWCVLAAATAGCGGRQHAGRSEEHTSELQSRLHLVCRLLLEKKKKIGDQLSYPQHN